LVTTIPFADKDVRPLNILEQAGAEVVINPLGRKLTEEDLGGMVSGVDILIAGTEPITETVLGRAQNLKLITRVGIGLDSVDLLAAHRRGIEISYTPDAPSPAVAELTIGLMIDLLRSVNVSNLRMHHGQWYRYFGRRLSKVTIGVIGLGRIGTQVLSYLSGFKCNRILVNDINPGVQTPSHPTCVVERTDKETIYREADIISLHVPLTAKTNNLITRKEMAAMKSDALLINTARGGIVNELDLFRALKAGDLGGAAIDVFEHEPYSGELADLDTCLLTAHMGSMSVDCRTQMELEACAEAARFIRGERLKSPVPQAEYDNQQSSR
jgi:D-3-phosphoglycerate dehydrogenase